ncbi:MAG: hypothetical protein GXP41_06800 [Chloroflexi bacterium]|nr:hypothetical protein [Chloroflexota bacterium]
MREILVEQEWGRHRLLLLLAAAILVIWLSPLDIVLGDISRLAYLHGAMVWVALICLTAGSLFGLIHLRTHRLAWHRRSQALIRAGLVFWIGYLPLSMWTAHLAWSRVFLAEPRYGMAVVIAIAGLSFQVGASLLESRRLGSLLNAALGLFVWTMLVRTPLVMHPEAPMRTSPSPGIKLFFLALVVIGLLIAVQVGYYLTPIKGQQATKTQTTQA